MSPAEELDERARQIIGLRGVADRLVADHQPDERGRCRGCRTHSGGPVWPCSLYGLGRRAKTLDALPILSEGGVE
jgi:hypothetical protein